MIIFFVLLVMCGFAHANLEYVDFDRSMRAEEFQHVIASEQAATRMGIPGIELMNFFEDLYARNNFLMIMPTTRPKIPKIIHQIWIGQKVPEKFKALQQTWKDHHPDWEYRFWTQHDIETFGFKNIDLLKASRNPGEISDMMRYEILHRFGGVYIDFDFECLQPLDELNYLYDFYIGIQPLDGGLVQLGIGLIGSIPGHPILKHAIEHMAENWDEHEGNAPLRTGPVFFTRSFFARAGKGGTMDIALPTHYLYPLGCKEFECKRDEWLQEGSFGIHHWASSWLRPSFRREAFRDLE